MKTNSAKATILMFVASFFWGSSFVGSKVCLNAGMLPFETVFYRMLIGVLGIAFIFRKQLRHFTKDAVKTGIALGLITSVIYTVEMYGITMIETSKASFLTSTNIVMMPFLVAIFYRKRPEFKSFIAAAITICGVALMSLKSGERFSFGFGGALMLFAAFLYAMNSIAVAKMSNGASPVQITFLQLGITMLFMGVMTAFQGAVGIHTPESFAAISFLAIGPTLICFLIKNYALQYLSPMKCTLILSTEGVFCAIMSVLILHDVITLKTFIGIILIFAGISTENFGDSLMKMFKSKRRV